MRPDQALAARLASWPDPFFAVIDGGGFADVRQVLRQADLPARSLFLEQRASVVVTAGPFLVPMDGRRLKRLLAIPGIEAACVFWAGPASEPEVFRHLRSINLACIPRPADAPPDPFAPAVESVLFRHWDPSVLSIVLPILEAAQRARLFGPMQRLVLFVPGQGDAPDEARQAVARPDWPPPPRGFLHFSPVQIDAIQSAMAARSHGRIARYLRDTAPDHTNGLDDAALRAVVTASEAEARHWGLRTEAGFGRFAWLMLVTRGGFARMEPARAYVTQGDAQPDRKLSDKAKDQPCADCGEVGCFNTPEGGDPDEMARQLKDQQDAINKMSPDELLENMDEYDTNGRPNDGATRTQARTDAAREARDNAMEQAAQKGKSSAEITQAGNQAANEAVAGKDVLHTPDLNAGGTGQISGMGDRSINRSIVSQWTKKAPGNTSARRDELRKAAEAAKKAGKKKMDVKLETCD